jgi:WhiB family redox-sensing transcriptional regulator
VFEDNSQNKDWRKLQEAIDKAEIDPACQNYPDAFFPEKGSTGLRAELMWAKQVCGQCPVKKQCSEYALKWEEFGIWGGLTAEDRRKLKSAARRAS